MNIRLLLAATAALAITAPATASLDVPVPVGAYITFGGLDWAWAIPLPGDTELGALDYQGTQGWRVPTAAELANAPNAVDFLIANGNVPFNGTDPVSGAQFQATNGDYTGTGACATPYFSDIYLHCDWQDGNGQPFGPWAGTPGAQGFADQLFVRDAAAVPEPAAWALMIAGFGLVGVSLRRRWATLAA